MIRVPSVVAELQDAPQLSTAQEFRGEVLSSFRPREHPRMLEWCLANIVNDQGRHYDHGAYPHLAAPGGPMDAIDDIHVREIAQQFATRLGKSFIAQCLLLYTAVVDPAPMLLASESERSLKRICERTYQMIYRSPVNAHLRSQSHRYHRQDHILFKECPIYGGWARSAGTLADMNIKVGAANEFDKDGWEGFGTTREGAPTKLFSDRFKDYWSVRKIVWESTPTVKGLSRVEQKRLSGTNCRYEVPCPHCKQYTTLPSTTEEVQDRLIGTLEESAWICPACEQSTYDYHRPWMMRRGVWCPQGCQVESEPALQVTEDALLHDKRHEWYGWSRAEWVSGKPDIDAEIASFQLSSSYALSLSWRDMVVEYKDSETKPELMRNYVNQWMGQTYQTHQQVQTWRELGEKIICTIPRGVVPMEHSVVVCSIDKQEEHYVYYVESWGVGRRSHCLEYGIADSLEEIKEDVLKHKWTHELGTQVKIKMTLIDRGFRPKSVDEFCIACRKEKIPVHACRGASMPLNSTYSKRTLGKDSATPGMKYILIDGQTTQDWIQSTLQFSALPDDGCFTVYDGQLGEHQDFLEQLLNEGPITKKGRDGKTREVWEKISGDDPNDYRDCKRYAAVAMLIATRGAPLRSPRKVAELREKRAAARKKNPPKPANDVTLLDRPGGWVQDWR